MSIEEKPEGEAPEQESVTQEQPETEAPQDGAEENLQEPRELDEIEQLAAQIGWAPPDQYRGQEGKPYKSAKEFLLDTPKIVNNLKQRIDRQDQDYAQRFQRQEQMALRALELQRQKIYNEFEAAKRNATATGDVEAYDQLQGQQTQAMQYYDQQTQAAYYPPQQQQQPPDPAVVQFAKRNNDWYMKDKVMTAASIVMLDDIDQQYGNSLPLADKLDLVQEQVRKQFPDRFQNRANGGGSQQVEGGLRQIRTNRGKGFNEMPAEAKQAYQTFKKQGVYSDPSEYAKDYWKQEQ